MLKVYSISLGCPKNRVDTERTLGGIPGIKAVTSPARADMVFVNTCGFIAPAIEESVRTILELAKELSELPNRPLFVVGGCLVGRYGIETLAPDLPEVDLLLSSKDVDSWSSLVLSALARKKKTTSALSPKGTVPRFLSTGSYAWLKVSEGCRHACSFCTIPAIRGGLKSMTAESLQQEAAFLLQKGVKELVLVAQDVSSWGRDFDQTLPYLLDKLLPLSGLHWLRLLYLYPAGLTKEVLSYLKSAGKPFIPYFDVPIQHASSRVLSRMGRPFALNPREAVDRIRNYFPEAALRTSIIVGFPGETDEDFQTLCDFVQETRFHNLGVFAYEAEEGTPAAEMADQIPDNVKQWRRDSLMEIQADISEEILADYGGTMQNIIVDAPHEEWPGLHTGRSWFQAPEIDGVTYISGKGVKPGALVKAEIMETQTYDLVALSESGAV